MGHNVLGLIPARGGSKGIPGKNLVPLLGRPLCAYTMETARVSTRLSRIIVSTDDPGVAELARELGIEVPFDRPPALSGDDTPAIDVIRHAVDWLEREEEWRPDIVVYLQPTSPLRRTEHIDGAVNLLINGKADTVVSVVEVPHHFNPVSVMRIVDGRLEPWRAGEIEALRRQDKPEVYARNGPAVLVCDRATVMERGVLYGPRTLPMVMAPEESVDIDTMMDLRLAEAILRGDHMPAPPLGSGEQGRRGDH